MQTFVNLTPLALLLAVALLTSSHLLVDAATFVSPSIPFYGTKSTSSMDVSAITMEAPFVRPQQQQQQQAPPKPDTSRTLYEILGASPTATRAELKQTYLARAKQFHPDVQQRRAGSSSRHPSMAPVDFSEITAAWSVLSVPEERRQYDQSLVVHQVSESIATAAQAVTDVAVVVLVAFSRVCFEMGQSVWMQHFTTTSTSTSPQP